MPDSTRLSEVYIRLPLACSLFLPFLPFRVPLSKKPVSDFDRAMLRVVRSMGRLMWAKPVLKAHPAPTNYIILYLVSFLIIYM